MDKIDEILRLIEKNDLETAVRRGAKYFQLEFSQNGEELIIPKHSPIWEMEDSKRLYFYSVAGVYYHFLWLEEYAVAFFREIWQGTNSLPVQWEYYSNCLLYTSPSPRD